jgi:hypothetical protein
MLNRLKRKMGNITLKKTVHWVQSFFVFAKYYLNEWIDDMEEACTTWFKYDRDKLWLVYTQSVPVIFEPPWSTHGEQAGNGFWLGRLKEREHWQDTDRDGRETGSDGLDWINLATERVQWRVLVDTVTNAWIPYKKNLSPVEAASSTITLLQAIGE